MDKNNDIKVNKVNKWDYGVVDMSLWRLKDEFDALVGKLNGVYGIDVFEIEELTGYMYTSMDKVLERFNELEAIHHKECGMVSQYEEENRNLKSELDIMTDENVCLITRVSKQDEEYQKLEAKYKELQETDEFHQKIHRKVQDEYAKIADENAELRSQCQSKEDALKKMIQEVTDLEKEKIDLEDRLAQSDELRYRAAKYAWAIKTLLKKASFSPGHVAEELGFMARKSTTPKDVYERWEGYADELLGEHSKLVDKVNRLEKENDKLKKENNNLTTDNRRLNDAVEAWFNMFNGMRHKRDDLKKEYEKLKKEKDELEKALNDKNKLIYKLTPKKSNLGSHKVPPTGCCGCCPVCTLKNICLVLND